MTRTQTLEDFVSAKVFDSRDVIARIDELQGERDGFTATCKECGATIDEPSDTCPSSDGEGPHLPEETWAEAYPEEADELAKLEAFEQEQGAADWRHGETFIADNYFEDYARELAEDIGAIRRHMSWPYTCIDWEEAADQLKQDYSSVELDGNTFWYRS